METIKQFLLAKTQYVFLVEKSEDNREVDMEKVVTGYQNVKLDEFHYWRKHANLEGFMRELYLSSCHLDNGTGLG